MVPAKGQHGFSGLQYSGGMLLNLLWDQAYVGRLASHIAAIHNPENVENAEIPGPAAQLPGQMLRCLANAFRTKASPRPAGVILHPMNVGRPNSGGSKV